MKIIMAFLYTVLISLLLLFAYTFIFNYQMDEKKALEILKANGYKDIKLIPGRDWVTCHKGEFQYMKFRARGQNNKTIAGAVCRGLVGSTTIRYR